MIFSEMLCKALDITPDLGELEGDCCICKKHTENGFKKKFSGNFTCADYISNGDVICPKCYYLVKNSNEYRRTMFLLTEKELIKFKKKEAKEIIGSGKIFKITITETDEDYSFFKNRNIMRAIPSSFKLPILPGMTFQKATYKPPYWDSAKATMCIVPRNQIKEAILNGKNI